MAYEKHEWHTGEIITQENMNAIENELEKVSNAIETLETDVVEKAPAIIGESTLKNSFSPEELASYTGEYKIECDASGNDHVYTINRQDLLYDSDALSGTWYSKTVGNNVHIEGTLSELSYIYNKYDGAYNQPLKEVIHAGDKLRFAIFANGTYTGDNSTSCVVGYPNLVYTDDTTDQSQYLMTSVKVDDSIATKVITAAKDVKAIKVYFGFKAGTFDCDVKWFLTNSNDDYTAETIPADDKIIIDDKNIVNAKGFLIVPPKAKASYVADTKTYIDDAVPEGMLTRADLNYVVPEQFGAVGDGTTDDSSAVQDALDYAAEHNKPLYVGGGVYFVENVLVRNGKSYEIFGNYVEDAVAWNAKPQNGFYIKTNSVGFIGERSSDEYTVASLPVVRFVMRHVMIKGQNGSVYPQAFKDIKMTSSLWDDVAIWYTSCCFSGMVAGNTLINNCKFHMFTDCAFRGFCDEHSIADTNDFVDARFSYNRFSGMTKYGGSVLCYPTVFEASRSYNNWFDSNFVANCWGFIGLINNYWYVLGWQTSNNIFTFTPYLLWKKHNGDHIIELVMSNFRYDAVWYSNYDTLVNESEGKQYFDDYSGNTRIPGDSVRFFNADGFTNVNIIGLMQRDPSDDGVLLDVTKIAYCNFTQTYLYPAGRTGEQNKSKNAFTTKFDLTEYNLDINNYKYDVIEQWNNRIVDTLPTIQDSNYRYVLEGQTCYYNHKLLTCFGTNWYDAAGNVVTA